MIRKLLGGIVGLLLLLSMAACEDTTWQTLGTVEKVGWSRGASTVYLTDGSAYLVSNDMIDDDCRKHAKLRVAGFLYSCW